MPICDCMRNECYCTIVRISCLLSFYNFELSPIYEARFQSYKKLFYVGTDEDVYLAFSVLHEVEITLINEIWDFYYEYWDAQENPTDIWST